MGFLSQAKVNQASKEQNVESTVLASAKFTAGSPEGTVTVNTVIAESKLQLVDSTSSYVRSISLDGTKRFTSHDTAPPVSQEQEKRQDFSMPSNKVSSADKHTKNSASAIRSLIIFLIIGPTSTLTFQNSPALTTP